MIVDKDYVGYSSVSEGSPELHYFYMSKWEDHYFLAF